MMDAVLNPIERFMMMCIAAMFSMFKIAIDYLLENTEPQIINTGGNGMAEAFQGQFMLTTRIGLYITVPLVLCATIATVLKGGGMKNLMNTYVVGLPVSVLGGIVMLTMAGLAQAINQNIVDYFDEGAHQSMYGFIGSIENVVENSNSVVGTALLASVLGLFLIFGLLAIMIELIAREITIYMALLFIPLAFASYVWSATRKWLFTLIELVLVMIFSKAILVAVLNLGFAAVIGSMGSAGASFMSQVAGMALGAIVLFLAAFSMPALVNLVLSPNNQVPLDRQQIQSANPLNSNRSYNRSQYTKPVGKLAGKVRGR